VVLAALVTAGCRGLWLLSHRDDAPRQRLAALQR
jgi:hypothetical protein